MTDERSDVPTVFDRVGAENYVTDAHLRFLNQPTPEPEPELWPA